MTIALVFPGQGSQVPGMAQAWRDSPGFGLWQQASDELGFDVERLGTTADAEELQQPANCQVALFVHHAVLLEAWRAQGQPDPAVVAGHSLGEYCALVAAGVLGFAQGLRLVHARATATQAAADAQPGTLVATLGYDLAVVEDAALRAGAYIANDNAPGQVVVAGSADALAELGRLLGEIPGRGRVLPLAVGAAYHSPHMQSAVEPLDAALAETDFADAAMPVIANVDAQPHRDAGEWRALLRAQVTAPVRWRESVLTMQGMGVEEVVELGASAVLAPLVKRSAPELGRRTVTDPEGLS